MDYEIKKSVHRLKSGEKEDAPLLVVFQAFYSSLKMHFKYSLLLVTLK